MNPGCTTCFTRNYPHYADRVMPDGAFWEVTGSTNMGIQGGHSATTAYGPYEMAPGECVNIVVSEGIAGLNFDAAVKIGRSYKRGGSGRDTRLIEYDADKDAVIDFTPFDYNLVFAGTEAQTKNQWVLTGRDSLFQMFYRARDLYYASRQMTVYPIAEPPRPPVRFSLFGRPDKIDLEWTPAGGGPIVESWEIYRTEGWEDNLYVNGCLEDLELECGYELVVSLPADAVQYSDRDVKFGMDYYYYLQGIGQGQAMDSTAIDGTPFGKPLRSGRYMTQTYRPVRLTRNPYAWEGGNVTDSRIVPNPVNLGASHNIRFPVDREVAFYDIPGECTIRIFTETGEMVRTLRHRNGSGEEYWNMTTDSGMGIVSGIYIAVIEDLSNGEQAFLKFAVIR